MMLASLPKQVTAAFWYIRVLALVIAAHQDGAPQSAAGIDAGVIHRDAVARTSTRPPLVPMVTIRPAPST